MKLYSIEYDHISGRKAKQTTSILTLSLWIDEAIADEYIVDGSINLFTTIRPDKKDDNINKPDTTKL